MTTTIRARFDGQVFIPAEPVNVPVDQDLLLHIDRQPPPEIGPAEEIQARLERARRTFSLLKDSPVVLSEEALRRGSF